MRRRGFVNRHGSVAWFTAGAVSFIFWVISMLLIMDDVFVFLPKPLRHIFAYCVVPIISVICTTQLLRRCSEDSWGIHLLKFSLSWAFLVSLLGLAAGMIGRLYALNTDPVYYSVYLFLLLAFPFIIVQTFLVALTLVIIYGFHISQRG